MVGYKITSTIDMRKVTKAYKEAFYESLLEPSKKLFKETIYGSERVPEKASVDLGPLRASGALFIEGKRVAISDYPLDGVRTGSLGPAIHAPKASRKEVQITFNQSYAMKIHEDKSLKPGPRSVQDGNSDPGNQWLMKHLYGGDGDSWFKKVGEEIKRIMKIKERDRVSKGVV